ncbi:RNA polymerase sigma factor [Aquisphaera insulae]|uniref:RNA polymerase sigma factor n=1 Tax=Aquisphaera insulae TaxID=2712864 RepID=UPI0020300649|nr:sigma-70 family RNA polymerase sigma factor [Aquisphaera insulae]
MDHPQPGRGSRPAAEAPSAAQLVEHFFRHESGRLVAVLVRVFGLRHLDLVEDMVQASLVEALQSWRTGEIPVEPSAWIHRVARNKVLDALRHRETVLRLAPSWARFRPRSCAPDFDDLFLDTEIADSQLRLMFACCHPSLAAEDRIALTLKSLGGFSNAEIARGLLVAEEAIKKRIQRARQQLVDRGVALAVPASGELLGRLDSVHRCLYLLFNEGYSATCGDSVLRLDLCEEAARLCHLLGEHPHCRTPETLALLALMLFHAARFDGRTDGDGRILLMEEQDRSSWDRSLIARARAFLDESASGRVASVFHLEAGIAMHHCEAPRFEETDWSSIRRLYDVLVARHSSPVHHLNRAIAIAYLEGPLAGIRQIEAIAAEPALRHYYMVDAALGELHRRAGNLGRAREHLARARDRTQSVRERELLEARLAACDD